MQKTLLKNSAWFFIMGVGILSLLTSCGQKIKKIESEKSKENKINSLVELAVASDSLNELQKSVAYYTEVLEMDSLKLIALINRGRAFLALSQPDKAFADYNKAVKHYPHENIYFVRGMAYCMINDFNNAFCDFAAAVIHNPKFGKAYYGYSLVKIHDRQYNYALYWCHKADSLSYDPGLSKSIKEEIERKRK